MIAELLGFAEFLLKSMSEISGQPLEDIKVIAMEGKFDQESFHEALPGMRGPFPNHRIISICTHVIVYKKISNLCQS